MKKFLSVLAVIAFVACNNNGDADKTDKDSIKSVIDSSAEAKKDSVENKSDSVKDRIDSAAKAKKDSLKK